MNKCLACVTALRKPGWYLSILVGAIIFAGLCLAGGYNYLLFHSIAEIFSIIVAFGIFVINDIAFRSLLNKRGFCDI